MVDTVGMRRWVRAPDMSGIYAKSPHVQALKSAVAYIQVALYIRMDKERWNL